MDASICASLKSKHLWNLVVLDVAFRMGTDELRFHPF
uniref:Uncharacterized protein n=1 Tax=Arundo donax TaxID=35708 RepID=A0A0A9BGF8_ARUDO